MHQLTLSLGLFMLLVSSLSFAQNNAVLTPITPAQQSEIESQTQIWRQGFTNSDVSAVVSIYNKNAILMPEYQPTLNGIDKIKHYYTTMGSRREIETFSVQSDEIFSIGEYIFDFRTFTATINWHHTKDKQKQQLKGKYWRIWQMDGAQAPKVIGEAFGFFAHLNNPEAWVTDMRVRKDPAPSGFHPNSSSIELKAYHAIGRIGVLQKNGKLRSQLYTEDAVFYPYASEAKRGIAVLEPYLIEYSTHDAYVDWLQTHTHDVIYLGQYIVEFTKFAVGWYYQGMPDQSFGKGMRLFKRMDNGELRIFRHFGTHNL